MPNKAHKTIVVTGASKGLGKYMAEQLLQDGYQVIGCARSEIKIEHEAFVAHQCDLSHSEDRLNLISHIRKESYPVYALINNAAMGALNQFLTTPTEKVHQIMQANYIANFELSRELAKLMLGRGGRIVNIGSQTLALNTPLEAAYASSKAAVETLTKITAKELAQMEITVNMVSPAVMDTRLIKGISQKRIDYMLAQQAWPQALQFSDVWAAVRFLLQDDAHRITGQNINVGVVS